MGFVLVTRIILASLVAQTVKNLPAMRETWVQSLGWEDPLDEGMATHFNILAWRIPMASVLYKIIFYFNLEQWKEPLDKGI